MEYGRREPMKSMSGREPTALTMKSIKELIAEELEASRGHAPTTRTPLPKSYLQTPPHMRGQMPAPGAAEPAAANRASLKASSAPALDAEKTAPPMPLPQLSSVEQAPAAGGECSESRKPRSFLGRLIGM